MDGSLTERLEEFEELFCPSETLRFLEFRAFKVRPVRLKLFYRADLLKDPSRNIRREVPFDSMSEATWPWRQVRVHSIKIQSRLTDQKV